MFIGFSLGKMNKIIMNKGKINRKGKLIEIEYKKPLKKGPKVKPKPGATIANPTAAPWLLGSAFKEAAAVYPGEAKPIASPIIAIPK